MHLQWIFIVLLGSCWITPTEETIGSWDLSSLLSAMIHGDHDIRSETVIERHSSRRKRSTGPTEYTVDIEISFPDTSLINQIKQYIATDLSLPITVGSSDTSITNISVTTECNQTGSNLQCSCQSGFRFPTNVCNSYSACSGSGASCNCIQGTSIPTQYCQLLPVSINLSLKILEQFTLDFTIPTSAKYKEYKAKIETQLNNTYQSLPGFISATVNGFRPGSVVADYTVVTEPVSPAALTTANKNLVDNLISANISVDSAIKKVVTDQSNITVSPSSIFDKDRVVLTCSVNATSYTAVSWYLNNIILGNSLYSTTSTGSSVQSNLTINMASQSDAGTYRCIIEDSSNSYQADTTIVVQPLSIVAMYSNITCNNMEIPIVQCCTQGPSLDFALTCSKTTTIEYVKSTSPCQTFLVSIDQASCPRSKTGSYSCTCATKNGANVTGNFKVTFQVKYGVNVTTTTPTQSEGKVLTVQCECNASAVQSVNWYLQNTIISAQYYTADLANCRSTLTIPANILRVSWAGTYQCSVDTGSDVPVSGSTTVNIAKLISSDQITVNPVVLNFQREQNINFSCRIDDTTTYKKASLQITSSQGTVSYDMITTNPNFTYTLTNVSYTGDFTARCIITNSNDDTVSSKNMQLKYVEDPNCKDKYVGVLGSNITVLCEDDDPKLTGTKIFICQFEGAKYIWKLNDSNCVSAALTNIQNTLTSLTSPTSQAELPAVIQNLGSTVQKETQSISQSPDNIQLVVNILQKVETVITKVSEPVMKDFLQTVDVVVDSPKTWDQVKNKEQKSSNLLQSVEKFAEKLTITGPVSIKNNTNVQLTGNIISKLASDYTADFDFSKTNNLTGNVLINKTTLYGLSPNATVISIAYATLKDILGNTGKNSSTAEVINGLVMTTTVTTNFSSFHIAMDFKKSNSSLNKAKCVFWNFNKTDWDDTGCHYQPNNDSTMVRCSCDHLTPFSVLMSSGDIDPITEEILTWITYFGLGISIVSLVICITIEATVWKSVTKNKTSYMRHVCIMNIAVTLLMADIWFIIGGSLEGDSNKVDACVAATFFTHVFYLCTFFWMLTMGLILFYRLMCVFHDLSKTVMMGISFFLGYGCPIIISVITVAVTQPRKTYTNDKSCWLNVTESKAFLAFVVPALTILLVNFITLFVVIIKVLRPSVGDRPKKEEKSSLNHIAKCILILTPLLGLTWGFGIGTLIDSKSSVLAGIFSALNALQGLFILLFGCLLDKKVRDALLSRFSISRWSSQQTKSSNLSSSDPVFSKGVINLFAKKGVYNISSAQAGSSSEMSNSYSLLT